MSKIEKIVNAIMVNQDKIDKENELGFFSISEPNRWCKNKDSNKWLTEKIGDEEIEVLNPIDERKSRQAKENGTLKSGVGDDVVSSMRNYIFEIDDIPLEEQRTYIEKLKENVINRSVYSGGKSYHNRITINSPNLISKEEYHYIWKCLNVLFFDGKADGQCKNPSRRTRVPNAWRQDKKVEQTMIVNNKNILYCYNYFHNRFVKEQKEQILMNEKNEFMRKCKEAINKKYGYKMNNVNVMNNEKVRHYLNTSYTKITGNGDSNISLYTAICVCITADDNNTLNLVLNKAKGEKWTEQELQKKIKEAKKFCKK